jgi:hypothetical protein
MASGVFVGAAFVGVAGEAVPEIKDVSGEKELDVGGVNAGPVADGESELEAMLSIRASRCADTVEMEFALACWGHKIIRWKDHAPSQLACKSSSRGRARRVGRSSLWLANEGTFSEVGRRSSR